VTTGYSYDGIEIEEFNDHENFITRGMEGHIIFVAARYGNTVFCYSSFNGKETWPDLDLAAELLT
jgi:hypothetical protein